MRVGLVIPNFTSLGGGAEQWTWHFAQGLLKDGHEVHVAARTFGDLANMPVVAHHLPGTASKTAFAQAAEDALRPLSFDVVHDMGEGWYGDVLQPHGGARAALCAQNMLLERPWLRPWKQLSTRLLPRYRQFTALATRQYADRSRLVIALSKMVARDFENYYQVPADSIRLIYNGVDARRYSPETAQPHRHVIRQQLGLHGKIVLLIVAHNFELKGVPNAIRATGQLRRQGAPVHLIVAGGKRFSAAQKLAERSGAADAVSFVGSVPDTLPYYAAADIYVHPTYYDSCSLVVLEAMACSVPVVTSRTNGASELLSVGENAYLLDDPANCQELVQCIEPLLDADRRVRFSESARRLAVDRSWERNIREVMAVYQEIADRRARRAA